jgi:hypothetical protein
VQRDATVRHEKTETSFLVADKAKILHSSLRSLGFSLMFFHE